MYTKKKYIQIFLTPIYLSYRQTTPVYIFEFWEFCYCEGDSTIKKKAYFNIIKFNNILVIHTTIMLFFSFLKLSMYVKGEWFFSHGLFFSSTPFSVKTQEKDVYWYTCNKNCCVGCLLEWIVMVKGEVKGMILRAEGRICKIKTDFPFDLTLNKLNWLLNHLKM